MAQPTEIKNLTIRVEDGIKKSFINCCKANDQTASQVLRAYMKEYIKKHGQGNLGL